MVPFHAIYYRGRGFCRGTNSQSKTGSHCKTHKRRRCGDCLICSATGSAFYAPSAAVVDMVETIVKIKRRYCRVPPYAKASTELTAFLLAFR